MCCVWLWAWPFSPSSVTNLNRKSSSYSTPTMWLKSALIHVDLPQPVEPTTSMTFSFFFKPFRLDEPRFFTMIPPDLWDSCNFTWWLVVFPFVRTGNENGRIFCFGFNLLVLLSPFVDVLTWNKYRYFQYLKVLSGTVNQNRSVTIRFNHSKWEIKWIYDMPFKGSLSFGILHIL